MWNGNFLTMRVCEIRVERIRVNQGLGVIFIWYLMQLQKDFPGTKNL